MENSGLTIPLAIRAPRGVLSWIFSNFETNGFGESRFLTLGPSPLQAAALGGGQAWAGTSRWNLGTPLPTESGVTGSPRISPAPFLPPPPGGGAQWKEVKEAAPSFWMPGGVVVNLHARSRSPGSLAISHRPLFSCPLPCLVLSPQLMGVSTVSGRSLICSQAWQTIGGGTQNLQTGGEFLVLKTKLTGRRRIV